jgi:hypothetical protein
MGKLAGWSLRDSDKDKKCGKCGMKEKKGGCCKDEHKQVKLTSEHQKANICEFAKLLDSPALPALSIQTDLPHLTPTAACNFYANAPPACQKQRLYLLHGVFLI